MLYTKDQFDHELKLWENRIVNNCKECKGLGCVQSTNSELMKMCECVKKSMTFTRLSLSGIPRKFLNESWNWDGFKNNSDARDAIKLYSQNFTNYYYNGEGIYLYGQQGRGKSMLEALCAKEVSFQINPDFNRNFTVAFMIFEKFIELSHDSRNSIEKRKLRDYFLEKVDLLILDNVGSETGTAAHNTKIFEYLLRTRNNASLPIFISSNYSPEQLTNVYSQTVSELIAEGSMIVKAEGDNFRARNAEVNSPFEF